MAPISYVELQAWAALTHSDPTPDEVKAIMALDTVFRRVMNARVRRRLDALGRRGGHDRLEGVREVVDVNDAEGARNLFRGFAASIRARKGGAGK